MVTTFLETVVLETVKETLEAEDLRSILLLILLLRSQTP